MDNYGKLRIHSSTELFNNIYEYGISQPDQTDPYIWGGLPVIVQNGDDYQLFSGLISGLYRWFIRKRSDLTIILSGYSEVVVVSRTILSTDIDDLFNYKLSTTKAAELAGIIQNEVYFTMLKMLRTQSTYQFFKETEIGSTLGTGLTFNTTKEVLKVFSSTGVMLRGGTAVLVDNILPVDLFNNNTLDYVILSGQNILIMFNPTFFSRVINFNFLCKENKYKNFTMEQFLRSEEKGGFGNDTNESVSLIDNFILSLQS